MIRLIIGILAILMGCSMWGKGNEFGGIVAIVWGILEVCVGVIKINEEGKK